MIDVFMHDRQVGTTIRVSVDSQGVEGNKDSHDPTITADGRFVAYWSEATNLVLGDTNRWVDVFVHGPHLTVEATPEVAPPGTSLSLTTWGGMPGGLAMLVVVDINGNPTFAKVPQASFDAGGLWTLAGTVPAALAGNVITFASFGINPDGKAEMTNLEAVTF